RGPSWPCCTSGCWTRRGARRPRESRRGSRPSSRRSSRERSRPSLRRRPRRSRGPALPSRCSSGSMTPPGWRSRRPMTFLRQMTGRRRRWWRSRSSTGRSFQRCAPAWTRPDEGPRSLSGR
ncbi:MAG: hypothetical protein EPO40_09880, partial [Myxococcaceae bacterium]